MRKKLTESSLENKSYVMSVYDSIDETEKIGFRKAIKQCMDENPDIKRALKFDAYATGYMLILLIVAIKIGAKELFLLPAAGAAGMALQGDMWKKLKECVRAKMGKTTTSSQTDSTQIKETKMKKTIRLTESELVELVQRIIKEDDMASKGFTIAGLYKKSSYTEPLPPRLVISQIEGRIKVDGVDKTVGSINITSRIECLGDCEITFKDVPNLGEVSITVKNGVPELFVTYE
jgi:hypothetical protein